MLHQLQTIFQNLSKSLEIFFVLMDTKPCCRIAVHESNIESIEEFCRTNNLFTAKSRFKVAMEFSGCYSTKGKHISPNSKTPGYFFYYISKSKQLSEHARNYEASLDYENFGKLLGYPDCCIDFFVRNKPKEEKNMNDYVLPALDNSQGQSFPFQNNVFTRYFDIAVLSHCPCSFSCEKSKAIADKNLFALKENDKKTYRHVLYWLKTASIYTNMGIILLKGRHSRLRKGSFVFSRVVSSQPNKLFYFLKERLAKRKNIIRISKEEIAHPFLVFE